MTTSVHALLTRISTGIGQHPYVTAALFFFGLGLVLWWSPAQRGTTPRPAAKLSPLDPSELDRALVERYETRFDGLQAQVQRQQRQFEATQAEQRKLTEDLQQRLDHGLAELRQLLTTRPATTTQAEPPSSSTRPYLSSHCATAATAVHGFSATYDAYTRNPARCRSRDRDAPHCAIASREFRIEYFTHWCIRTRRSGTPPPSLAPYQ